MTSSRKSCQKEPIIIIKKQINNRPVSQLIIEKQLRADPSFTHILRIRIEDSFNESFI